MNGSRQKQLLYVLGGLLLIVAWQYWPSSSKDAGDALRGPAAQRAATDEEGDSPRAARPVSGREVQHARPGDRVVAIRAAELDSIPSFGVSGRDPWRFYVPPPPPPPPAPKPHVKTAAELEAERLARERAEAEARERARIAAIPRPPEFTLQYVGHFGPPTRKVAVFSDGKNELIALEGDTLNNRFIVSRIGLESVEIKFVGFPDVPAKRVGIGRR